ncbi:MAG TPA: HEAT repeat domain-containing protein [Kofleriaceae bacterium]|nr:HEAT repeat domain-containing protein [Kofleriaceae bacterium]
MTAGRARAGDRRRRRRGIEAVLAVIAAVMLHATPARADNVDKLIGQLDDSSEKIRLSAVVNLTKLGDPRAIAPLIRRLKDDDNKNVRVLSASGLGTLVTAQVKGKLRADAEQALRDAAANDPHPSVQAQAQRALNLIGASGPATPPPRSGGGVYVNIGPMSSKTGSPDDPKLRAMMEKVATKTMGKAASNMPTTWPGGGVPTKAALAQRNVQGFFIDGTLNQLQVTTSGSTATISCKVNMLLAEFPSKSMIGFLNGGAKVQASSSPSDIALAREDCVSAVVEDLIAKKIVPTIKTKAGIP